MKLAIETALAFVTLPNAQPPRSSQTAASYYLLNGQTREAADTWVRSDSNSQPPHPLSMGSFWRYPLLTRGI